MPWSEYLQQALQIWDAGGWLMWPLALVGLIIYASFFELFFYLQGHEVLTLDRPQRSSSRRLNEWFESVKRLSRTPQDVQVRFQEARLSCLAVVDRRLRFIRTILPTGPLLGLLGTVMGMLLTFNSLGRGRQGGIMEEVAGGISEALITTQTGLLIAAPGYLLLSILQRRRNRLEQTLSHLEIQVMDVVWRRIHGAILPPSPPAT